MHVLLALHHLRLGALSLIENERKTITMAGQPTQPKSVHYRFMFTVNVTNVPIGLQAPSFVGVLVLIIGTELLISGGSPWPCSRGLHGLHKHCSGV